MSKKIHHRIKPSTRLFLRHLRINLTIGFGVIAISLYLGMVGYRHYENMTWIDAYVNAAMILSGMGPVSELHTDAGKIFAGSYALFSGVVFLVVIAIILAPAFRHFFHKMHVEGTTGSASNP